MLERSPVTKWCRFRPRSPLERFERNLHWESDILFDERLTDGIALIVIPTAGEGEEFGLEVRQPKGPFGQKSLASFELRRRNRHAADFIPCWLYGNYPGDLRIQFLNERGAGRCVFDEHALRVPLPGEGLHGTLQRMVVNPPSPDVEEIPMSFARHDPGCANRPVVVRPPLAGGVPTLQRQEPLKV